jgi:glycosyltransferase involved in cell wall biosynthesis
MRVAACICTFRRPEQLRRLLSTLAAGSTRPPLEHVLVVDNDPSGTAAPVVEEFRSSLPDVRYVVEPTPGLSAARNRLAELVRASSAEFAVFLDDDQTVTPGWLDRLVATATEFEAAIVAGAVVPKFETDEPAWIIQGPFFARERFRTGSAVRRLGIANVLVRADVLARSDKPFGESFARGAEDTYFLRTAGPAIWCDEAVVYEHIPPARAKLSFLLRRAFFAGLFYSRVLRMTSRQRGWRGKRALACLARLVQGSCGVVAALPRGRASLVRSLQLSLSAIGGLVGLVERSSS